MSPVAAVPDLVVEVLSPSDSREALDEKLRDYQTVKVRECWLVSPEAETMEVMRISPENINPLGLYGRNETVGSEVFPNLNLPVREVFI
ncbi:MAG: Uma2 family endonuclease [Acidobacteria bacterium]|nr:Uma2 family endonuclease [Acidobacteriota bacterium]MCI0626659.1 Uma2 family endonuclease [Acidobacteriota bacterium]